ncbi:polymorphic toxin type 15 domain-containing protein [Rhodohalobacter sp. 8-1]|uniref:polymorphic toxin type 15 domain-containing protein n=1 Tax=Rhodohalobacter sp. 8-1 TaxID=3131972 RepID=UPI0030EB87FE
MPTLAAKPKPRTLDERPPAFDDELDTSSIETNSPDINSAESQIHTNGESSFQMAPNPSSDTPPPLNGNSAPSIDMAPVSSSHAEPSMMVEEESVEEESQESELLESEVSGGLPGTPPEDEEERKQEEEISGREPGTNPSSPDTLPQKSEAGVSQDTTTGEANGQPLEMELSQEDQAAQDTEGNEEQESKTSDTEEEAPEIPRSPEEDPEFQAVVSRSEQRASGQQAHRPAQTEVSSAQSAAPSPGNETESRAQAAQVEEMDQQEPGTFNADAFKQLLLDQIAAILPTNEKDADKFSKDDRMDQVQNAASNQVGQEKERAAGSIENSTRQEPDTSSVEERQPTDLEQPDPGPEPADIAADEAMPNARPAAEVTAPLQENAVEMDQQMQQAEVTDEQLANSNEPQFTQALNKKKEAKQHTEQAPTQMRQQEQVILDNSQSQAQATGQQQLEGMHDNRSSLLGQVMGQQEELMGQNTAERQQVADHINEIYETTKTDVEEILSALDEEVNHQFEQGAEKAKIAFENHVDREMKAYKKERYGEWFDVTGWGKRLGDAVTGLPDEVNKFFKEGRQLYIDKMDIVLTGISEFVANKLNEATERINTGKQNVQDYVTSLPENLQEAGQQAAEEIQSKFDELQQNVNSKQDELVDSLAQQYKESLDAVDARIEEMKAANRGLVDAALSALTGVIETILRIKNMLSNMLSGAMAAIQAIISDPIGFLGNLIQGVKNGLMNFMSRILVHLQSGLIGWLTGALGPVGIQIPDDLFSLKGIFSLVVQVLGLTWDYVREKAVQLFGEPVVNALETGLELFQTLRNEGITGLWEYVKEQFTDLKETVIGAIKEMVITQVLQAGIKWMMGLLNPAGAFVKAAMLIIDIVKFFIERGSQIIELVNAITESIRAIASGNVGEVAAKIENALKRAVPVLIGFLASLLGISGLARKVQNLINKIRKRIDKAITKVLMKAKKAAGKLLAKLGIGKDKTKPDPRSQEEIRKDLDDATKEANSYLDEKDASPEEVKDKLSGLKMKYDLNEAELKQNPSNEKYYIELKINPLSKTDEEQLEGKKDGIYERIAPYTVKFNSPKEKYEREFPGEYETQIAAQVAGLNQMKVSRWLKNRKAFIKRKATSRSGRDPESAKLQREFRREKKLEMIQDLMEENEEMLYSEAEEIVEERMSELAALHDPDQIAGGEASGITRLGAKNINSSIGAQWRYRIGGLTTHVKSEMKKVPDKNKSTVKMNVDYKLG